MPAPPRDLGARSLLAVLAHPDDESLACGGLLALCARSGVRVALLCLTRGEQGPGGRRGALGDRRAAELEEATRVLGIAEVALLDHEDGMLPWIDHALLEADILRAIRRVDPDIVLTFDEDGLYWHPDHIAVHERTTAVVAALGATAPALFYVSMQPGAMRALVEEATTTPETSTGASSPARILGVDPSAFGSMAPAPTLVVEAGPLATRKLAALRCHRTQVEGSALDHVDAGTAARLLGTEQYRRGQVGAQGDAFIERFGTPVASATS